MSTLAPQMIAPAPAANQRVAQALKLHWAELLILFVTVGNLLMSRSFAHIGLPPIFIGEVAMVVLFFGCPAAMALPMVRALARPGPLNLIAWAIYISLTYGVAQAVRGFYLGHMPMITLQNIVFHTYPLFIFAGAWVGSRRPEILPKLILALSWLNGMYGIAYIGLLSPMGLTDDLDQFGEVSWFGQPGGSMFCLMGLAAYSLKETRVRIPLFLNMLVLLGIQVRADWLGFTVGLGLWCVLTGKMRPLFTVAGAIGTTILLAAALDLKMPSPETRGGEISARGLVARAISSVDEDLAKQFYPEADSYAATVSWRTGWWEALWKETHRNVGTTFFGLGYGYPIWEHHPEHLSDENLRTPHNVFVYALSYTGWVGIGIFVFLHVSVLTVLWRVYKKTGDPFGVCYLCAELASASFDNFFETPFGAIPCFMLVGISMGPMLHAQEQNRKNRKLQPLPTNS